MGSREFGKFNYEIFILSNKNNLLCHDSEYFYAMYNITLLLFSIVSLYYIVTDTMLCYWCWWLEIYGLWITVSTSNEPCWKLEIFTQIFNDTIENIKENVYKFITIYHLLPVDIINQ